MDEELRFHLQSQIADAVKAGMSPDEASRTVLATFGGFDKTKEECRDTRPVRLLNDLRQDLRYAVRVLAKSPGFTAVAVLVLALGIGANTAVVSAIDAIVFRPLPFAQLDRLVGFSPGANLVNFFDVRDDHQVFSGVAAYIGIPLMAKVDGSAFLSGRGVSANFFQVLGLSLAAGRGFSPDEDKMPYGRSVVVISHRIWMDRFAGDAAIIGKTLRLNREPMTVVGVAPRGFRDAEPGGPQQDLWIPIPMFGKVMRIEEESYYHEATERRDYDPFLALVGRLNPGVTIEQASARLSILTGNLRKVYPEIDRNWNPKLVPETRARWPVGSVLFSSAVLSAASVCLLLIACMNVAGLLIARGATRRREIATRLALGARRARVARQLLAETSVLGAMALAASSVAYGLTLRCLPAFEKYPGFILMLDLGINYRAMIFATSITLLTLLLCGLAPALGVSRVDLTMALKNQGLMTTGRGGSRWRRVLVVSQVALSVVLLVAAGLFARMIRHFESVDPGIDRDVLLLDSHFLSSSRPEDRIKATAFYRHSLEQIRRVPGVRSASWGVDSTFDRRGHLGEKIRPESLGEGNDKWLSVRSNVVSDGYFRTLGIPILQGRDFTDQDWGHSGRSVIINETLARRYWPGMIPLGKRIQVEGRGQERFEVVGVVRDAKYWTLWEDKVPFVYFPFSDEFYFEQHLHVSALGDPKSLIDPLRKVCAAVDPDAEIDNGRLMSEQAAALLSQERSSARVLGVFGALALVLAAVGLYGIVSCSVAARTHEFGIRMAIGARSLDILRQVIREGMNLTFAGLAVGLPCSMALSRFIASRMHGVSVVDPFTYLAIAGLCVATSFVAIFLPARRATASPIDALRSE
jgi:putative ABC transport system permease protein